MLDIIEVSNIRFDGNNKEVICSFVPSFGKTDIIYNVTMESHNNSFPDVTAMADYENGICTVAFNKSKLLEHAEYPIQGRLPKYSISRFLL